MSDDFWRNHFECPTCCYSTNSYTRFLNHGKEHSNVPADSFVRTLAANVDNGKMTDAEFRQFVRNTLPIVER
jgi:hypothetical protein